MRAVAKHTRRLRSRPHTHFPLLLRYYLDDVQKGQNSQYDSDHDQGMDPASAIRPVVIPGTPTEETKQPKNKQDYDNGPQHEITPFE